MLRNIVRLLIVLFAIVGAIAIGIGMSLLRGGISARNSPGATETAVAKRLRAAAIPREARERRNPVQASAEALKEGMEHFADHCAICHGNDGSGDTEIGRGLYPRAPDMRQAATQNLTDGELYYIIENGVRLTGMPAWGGGGEHDTTDNWRLVLFIRHLPKLTDAELDTMKQLNPKSPDEFKQDEEMRKFLEGGSPSGQTPPPHSHTHGGRGGKG
jgi:mono/diheme cytochrome c family protein